MAERALNVLENFRVGACQYETEVIDWLEDRLETKEVHIKNDGEERILQRAAELGVKLYG